LLAGCSDGTPSKTTAVKPPARPHPHRHAVRPTSIATRALGLPPVHSRVVPGYILIADRNNNRALIVSPSKQVVWQKGGLNDPDDASFTPGYR